MTSAAALGSTYRLQLNGLGFTGARALVPYLHRLGIETLYLSPILAAAPGSTHGYDVIDPDRLDPALGSAEEFESLLEELAAHGMRALLDIVPNHMAAERANRWWWDTLRRGRDSAYAGTFDIDWSQHGGRVLLPVLGAPLAQTAASASVRDEADGAVLEMGDQDFPLLSDGVPGGSITGLLAAQHFRPAYWRLGDTAGNYRRFFNIDGLVGVRVEDPDVFTRTHGLILQPLRRRKDRRAPRRPRRRPVGPGAVPGPPGRRARRSRSEPCGPGGEDPQPRRGDRPTLARRRDHRLRIRRPGGRALPRRVRLPAAVRHRVDAHGRTRHVRGVGGGRQAGDARPDLRVPARSVGPADPGGARRGPRRARPVAERRPPSLGGADHRTRRLPDVSRWCAALARRRRHTRTGCRPDPGRRGSGGGSGGRTGRTAPWWRKPGPGALGSTSAAAGSS